MPEGTMAMAMAIVAIGIIIIVTAGNFDADLSMK